MPSLRELLNNVKESQIHNDKFASLSEVDREKIEENFEIDMLRPRLKVEFDDLEQKLSELNGKLDKGGITETINIYEAQPNEDADAYYHETGNMQDVIVDSDDRFERYSATEISIMEKNVAQLQSVFTRARNAIDECDEKFHADAKLTSEQYQRYVNHESNKQLLDEYKSGNPSINDLVTAIENNRQDLLHQFLVKFNMTEQEYCDTLSKTLEACRKNYVDMAYGMHKSQKKIEKDTFLSTHDGMPTALIRKYIDSANPNIETVDKYVKDEDLLSVDSRILLIEVFEKQVSDKLDRRVSKHEKRVYTIKVTKEFIDEVLDKFTSGSAEFKENLKALKQEIEEYEARPDVQLKIIMHSLNLFAFEYIQEVTEHYNFLNGINDLGWFRKIKHSKGIDIVRKIEKHQKHVQSTLDEYKQQGGSIQDQYKKLETLIDKTNELRNIVRSHQQINLDGFNKDNKKHGSVSRRITQM